MTQTTCPLHINSKNSEKEGDCDDGNNIPFSQRDLPPSLSLTHRESQNGKMELIKIFIDFYFYLLRLLDFFLPLASGKEKCEKEVSREGKVKKKDRE